MCTIVVINEGEKDIESPRQFEAHFGFPADPYLQDDDMDCCLCNCDIDAAFHENDVQYIQANDGDYYVIEECE